MNHILYNISLVILVIGIILMTVYITKASNNSYLTYDKQILNKQAGLKKTRSDNSIYDYKVNKEYQKMFSQPSIWMGYQDFDPKERMDKIYVK
jgi:hypothetical protein